MIMWKKGLNLSREEMVDYSRSSKLAIKFDFKKFYHEIDIHPDYQKYFKFMFQMKDGCLTEMFVWTSVAEPHDFYAAPAAPAPTLLYSKAKFLK
jgi:hypothetical protein